MAFAIRDKMKNESLIISTGIHFWASLREGITYNNALSSLSLSIDRARMDPYQSKRMAKYQKNGVALFLLVVLGCGIVFFAIVQMACSFVVNYAEDFESPEKLDEYVQSRLSYSQYWAGIPVSERFVRGGTRSLYDRNQTWNPLFAVIYNLI